MAKKKKHAVDLAALEQEKHKLSDAAYEARLDKLQKQLMSIQEAYLMQNRRAVILFEGTDAAGKGGTIRRLLSAIDARNVRVMAVAAPTDEERAHPYLWRFWRDLPRLGHATIYDRTWYGRVLVERVEGFCAPEDWKRAFGEISSFEEELSEAGVVLCKFWLQISPEEQLRRFHSRVQTPFKQYKLTPEDWRNRGKWDAYQAAALEMIERTGTPESPWSLIEAEDKKWARVKVLKTIADRLEKALD
jgi:AMP-polyphosphate phosphotransferase